MRTKLLGDAITLFVVINPIGLVPLFLALTRDQTPEHRRQIALRSVLLSTAVLVVFVVIGQMLLDGLGVGVAAFRVGGGLVLLLVALRMVISETDTRTTSSVPERGEAPRDVAVFPLAVPLIAGPGAVMAVVLLTDNDQFTVVEQAGTTAVLLGVLALTYVFMRAAGLIQRWIGMTGANVLSRVLGLVLTGLAAETILQGVRVFFRAQ
jgi:multiple antibiotic resistance protein